jgi:RecG-like helicase
MNEKDGMKQMKKAPVKTRSPKTFAGVPLIFADACTENRRFFSPLVRSKGHEACFEGEVIWIREGKTLLASVRSETSTIDVRVFHPTAFHRRIFFRGAQVKLRGKLTRWHGRPCLVHPKIILR